MIVVKRHSIVEIISPSSPVDRDEVAAGIDILERAGFRVRLGKHVFDRHGHSAGKDRDRAADFENAYLRSDTDILWCARGGSSSCKILPLINWNKLAQSRPKVLIGYSDVTSLHLACQTHLGYPTLHGPMIFELGTRISEFAQTLLLNAASEFPNVQCINAPECHTRVGGRAVGITVGGCLTLIRASIGTKFQPDLAGKLLLLEDIDSKPWQIERDLWQLDQAGMMDGVAGFIVGEATGADETNPRTMADIWDEALSKYKKPFVTGFPFGHVANNMPVALGITAAFDADAKTLFFNYSVFGDN